MEQTLYPKWVDSFFRKLALKTVVTLNGEDARKAATYRHKTMLRKDYSTSGKWESLNIANTQIMADVVAMNSPLPLKKRDSWGKANGDIPKMGLELGLDEKQLTELDQIIEQGGLEADVVARLFSDVKKIITAIYERNEYIFLEGLSSGLALVEDTENVGTGIRLNYGYSPANTFGVDVLWSSPTTAKPDEDIKRLLAKAKLDGNTITKVMLDSYALDYLAATDQMKQLYAFKQNFVGTNIPAPDINQLNTLTSSRYGFTFELVDRSMRYEKNGNQTTVKPWAEGQMIFLTSDQVGSLVWARLAEARRANEIKKATYQTIEDYILLSKYHQLKPFSEFTAGQARVVPVINNVDQIYRLDMKTVQA